MKSIPITSLVGDALSLGSHWIYNQREITEKFDGIPGYSDPTLNECLLATAVKAVGEVRKCQSNH